MELHTTGSLPYFLHGAHPSLLFLSGLHGNEYESGRIFEALLPTLPLPDFLYIPKGSPSAVADGSRTNQYGHDLNRQFLTDTADAEAKDIMQLLAPYHFRLAIDIHEDPDRTASFYMYDSGKMSGEQLLLYRDVVRKSGARLYTGIDDFEDQHLGFRVEGGYISMPPPASDEQAGFFLFWSINRHIADRGFTLEIPGKAPFGLKKSMLETLMPLVVQFA